MRTSDYWERRFTAMDDAMYKNTEQYIKSLQKRFERATRQMSKDMAYWYSKLAENNEISYQAARQLLSQDELEDFKMTLEEYIKHGSELDLDPSWRKKLVNASAKVHISRLEEMQLELQNTIENLYSEYNGSLTEYLSELVPNTYYHTAYEIAKGTGVATTLHKLDSEAINQFLTKPWVEDGKAFSERIWARRDDLVNSVNKELTQLLITGKDPQKAIDTIARDFAVDKSAAGRLVMTESAAMANEARRQCMKDLDVEEYEVIATLDSKTSPICRSMDGKHFPMTQFKIGVNAPPFHCNCRTTTVPYFDDEFTKNEERAARDENDTNYIRTQSLNYSEWEKRYVVDADNAHFIKTKLKDVNSRAESMQIIEFGRRVNPDVANGVLDEIENARELFGDINIKGVGILETNADFDGVYENGRIGLKNIQGDNAKIRLTERAKKMKESGKWSTSSDRHTIRHEIGHGVAENAKLQPGWELKSKQISDIIQEIKPTDVSDIVAVQNLYAKNLSIYAFENIDEFIAESVAEYMNGANKCRPIAKRVVGILRR